VFHGVGERGDRVLLYGASAETGPLDALQAEYARVPYAHTNLIGLPDSISDAQRAIRR
jgi:threonine dehydrogenase-like Zn-dependent dehydrogenase